MKNELIFVFYISYRKHNVNVYKYTSNKVELFTISNVNFYVSKVRIQTYLTMI